MRAAYDADAVRKAEAPLLATLPDGALMQRAATALARRCAALLDRVYGARVVVLAGGGHNGGDALFAGTALARRGCRIDVVRVSDKVFEPALSSAIAAGAAVFDAGTVESTALLRDADLVIDGMLGIGGSGGLREPAADVAKTLESTGGLVVSVDVPSGVDASTGEVSGAAVRADVTVTFGALKAGLVVAPGASYSGFIEVVDIGLSMSAPDVSLLDASDVAALLPSPPDETDKYRRGVVGVVAGSDTYTGAAVLAVGGAITGGAGMVRFAGVAHPAELVRLRWPEAVVTVVQPGDGDGLLACGRVQAWVVGSGLGTDDDAAALVRAVLGTDLPVLLDADAITVVSDHRDWVSGRYAPTLLTPHAGEFARLMGLERDDVEAHRLGHVRRAAADLGVTVLLKGSTTLIAEPSGHVRVNSAHTPFLATAGSGDVLSGLCGALLAGGLSPLDAGSVGAFLHGLSGLIAAADPSTPINALDLVEHLPAAMSSVHS
jgi:ADP-dependent NAD(P)H-hydrate dehydratase / NAD(P)H-hydrate epimerase